MTDRTTDDAQAMHEAKPRRLGRYAGMILAALAFAYWASPYVAVASFARAVQAGPDAAVITRLDMNSLRNGFSRQIVRAYVARHPQTRDLDRFSRTAVSSVAAAYVSGIVADRLTPETIAELLRRGRSAAPAAQGLLDGGAPLPRIDSLRQGWALFQASGFSGLSRFRVDTAALTGAAGFGLVFGLGGEGWLLRTVELPEATLERLVSELSTRIGTGG